MKLSTLLYGFAYASIALSASLKLTAKDDGSERNAVFVGLWPPTFLALAKVAEDREASTGTALKSTSA